MTTCDNLINDMHMCTHAVALPTPTTATLMGLLTSIGTDGNVWWLLADETALIDFLTTNKDKAGDGLSFKQSVCNAAAEHLQQVTTKGAPKTAGKCKAKWGIVCTVAQKTVPMFGHFIMFGL